MKESKILIIIPAYNEGRSIDSVLTDIERHVPEADILVVNDGSSDSTSDIARGKGVFVLDLPFNLGIGAAMQAGYKFAREKDYDIAVQCNGDGQHPPYQIKNLVNFLVENEVDIVVGSRFLRKYCYRSSFTRQMGIIIFSRLISFIARTRLTDTTSGFRALSKEAIRSFAAYYPCDYPEVEALVLAHKENLKIREFPVKIYPRKQGVSSIGFFSSVYYTIKVFLAVIIDWFEVVPYSKKEGK